MINLNLLNSQEVADLLKVDIRTIQKMAQANYFPQGVCGRIGNKYIFKLEPLIDFIFSERKVGA